MRNDSEPASSFRAIENLIAAYAELVDRGDFAGVGTLLRAATFTGSGPSVRGAAAIETMLRNTVILYDDGTPKTKHLIANISITVDEDARTGTARSYLTVLQALPGLPLQPIASGRYHDRFERHDGEWVFAERRVSIDLVGDVSHHLRNRAADS
jgi:SnoaL-like domain